MKEYGAAIPNSPDGAEDDKSVVLSLEIEPPPSREKGLVLPLWISDEILKKEDTIWARLEFLVHFFSGRDCILIRAEPGKQVEIAGLNEPPRVVKMPTDDIELTFSWKKSAKKSVRLIGNPVTKLKLTGEFIADAL